MHLERSARKMRAHRKYTRKEIAFKIEQCIPMALHRIIFNIPGTCYFLFCILHKHSTRIYSVCPCSVLVIFNLIFLLYDKITVILSAHCRVHYPKGFYFLGQVLFIICSVLYDCICIESRSN
ncbi:uncharacterized protein NESG_00533 [Nematocida ausubeli]|uniref:Uncharacterized protein n=1 Tax=Nematocida ausubeli (strain ATCC PRA-371 / ERTm2) TaxID=1913371 RepID=A0A086J5N6_NEMA1|nr:uncharacterized protein NESG_00533 [Nematocida ausubeli]KFG27454.1 hypothetical protein NESG_00533 [Nematocida ausubeli]